MTESDVQAILEQILEIQAAAGSIAGTAQIIHESKNWNTTINGTTTGHFTGARLAARVRTLFFPVAEEAGRPQSRDPRQRRRARAVRAGR